MRIFLPNGDELEYLTDLTATVQTEDGEGFEGKISHMSILHPHMPNDDEPVIISPQNFKMDVVLTDVDPEAIRILLGVNELWTP